MKGSAIIVRGYVKGPNDARDAMWPGCGCLGSLESLRSLDLADAPLYHPPCMRDCLRRANGLANLFQLEHGANRVESGFGLSIAVKQQRVVDAAPGEII